MDGHVIEDNLRMLRARDRLSQTALAERLGVSKYTVCRWERGHALDMGLDNAVKVADVFGVTLDSLAGRTRLDCGMQEE